MPSGKSKEDTWKSADLEKQIRDAKDDRRKTRDKDKDRDRRKDRPKEDVIDDKKHSSKKRDDDRHKDRDRDRDRERRHRDRENGESDKREKPKEKDRDRDRDRDKHRSKDDDRRKDDKERRKKRDEDPDDRERRHRKQKDTENDEDRERRHRRHREEEDPDDRERRHRRQKDTDNEEDRERKHRRHKEEENGDDRDRQTRKHKDEDGGDREDRHRKHRDDDAERGERRHRRYRDRSRSQDEDGDKKKDDRKKHRDGDDERRRRPRDDDDKKKRRDEDDRKQRKHRDVEEEEKKPRKRDDETEEERRKRKDKEREKRKKEKEEEEKRKKIEEEQKKKGAEDEDDYNYDDEDFEDYDDDFEDDADDDDKDDDDDDDDEPAQKSRPTKFNSEMDEILQAMNDENDRLLANSRKDTWSDSTEDDREKSKSKPASNRTFINFVSAKQRTFSDKAANKARRRGIELQQIIEFDVTSYDLFDMPPVKEYDMYIRTFGSSNTKQAYQQTNDDNIDRELQTEDIESRDKWCQHPPDDVAGCGGEGEGEEDPSRREEKPMDAVKLGKFLEASGQVMAVLIEEDFADKVQSDLSRKQSNICVSDAYIELGALPLLEGRHVVASKFSPAQTHMLLSAYSPGPDEDLTSQRGIICVWNVNEPSRPQKVLMCESLPRCCCFSPLKSTLAFAGMTDGSLAVWDLREASTLHKTHHDGKGDWVLRYPTYNTAGVLHYENHESAIVAVCPIVASGDSSESGEGLSFQLASLEENSRIHLWVVAEISNPDMAGSESDLGLVPGGRVKLIKSSSIVLESPLRDPRFRTTMECYDMQLLPSNNSHYYVTSNMGCVNHGVRYGGKAPPKAYRTESDSLVNVTSIDFSPFTEPVFLAGCEDGGLRLYHIDGEYPLIAWPNATEGRPIKMVRWCRSRPSVFFVLDKYSCIYIWDLNMDDAVPLKSEKISGSRVTSFCLSNDHSATGMGMAGRRPQMVVSLDDGRVEVHTISKEFSALMPEEVDQFAVLLQKTA